MEGRHPRLTPLPSGRLSSAADIPADGRPVYYGGIGSGYMATTWIGTFA